MRRVENQLLVQKYADLGLHASKWAFCRSSGAVFVPMEWISGYPGRSIANECRPIVSFRKMPFLCLRCDLEETCGWGRLPGGAGGAEGVIMERGRTYCAALCSTLRWTMQCAAKADAPHCVGCFIQAQLQAGNAVVWHGARRAVCRSRHSFGQGRFRFLRPMPKPRARGVPDSRSGHPLPPVRSPSRRRGRWIGAG